MELARASLGELRPGVHLCAHLILHTEGQGQLLATDLSFNEQVSLISQCTGFILTSLDQISELVQLLDVLDTSFAELGNWFTPEELLSVFMCILESSEGP